MGLLYECLKEPAINADSDVIVCKIVYLFIRMDLACLRRMGGKV
jgi:hypothetical protein